MDTNLKIESWKVDPTTQKVTELNLNAEISDSIKINGETVGGDSSLPAEVLYDEP